jgi:lysyl-tRNA synthetase class 2
MTKEHHKTEQALVGVRKDKAARVRERGDNPFANDVGALTALAEVRRACEGALLPDGKYDPTRVEPRPFTVAGRVLFLRGMGGATFVRLRDRSGELQLYFEEEPLGAAYQRLEELDLGDIVEARGVTMATQRGELSVRVEGFRLLTKSFRPLPTKTTFKDVEQRYRMRYVDLVANAEVRTVFQARTNIVSALRAFLDERGFLEVETPTMHTVIGGAIARPFTTHHNTLDLDLYLRIAPELFLKRLVVGGFERVYEIARCYRNEGISTRHNPEFSMLEFYMAYATYETLMDLTEELLRFVDGRLAAALPQAHQAWQAERPFTFERFVRLPMTDAIEAALSKAGLGAEVVDAIGGEAPAIKEWAARAKANKRTIDWTAYRQGALKCASRGERVFAAYEYLAEPFLAADYRHGDKSAPVFITDYPAEVSPLARRKDRDPSLVDRFELFVNGQELCNAFSELNDPDDQAARFAAQQEAKSRGAEETMDYDHDYIRALEHGMPPAAGFGMGVDRLIMMLTGAASIRDVILFPLLRPEAS